MKEKLKDKYKIDIEDYIEYKEGIIFFLDGYRYYFVKHDFDEEFLNVLNSLVKELKSKKIYLHDFIFDKFGHIDADGYCLMRLNFFIDEVTDEDLKLFYSVRNFSEKLYSQYVSTIELWCKKIDYFEYQVSELSNKSIINNSFDYYIGITELLLQFLSNYEEKEVNKYLSLSHRKLDSFNTLDFYNPLNIIIDIYTRDLGLYVKSNYDYDYLLQFLERANKDYAYYYLYFRLILPSDYFNILESILIDNKSDEMMANYINDHIKYENYIINISEIFGFNLFYWLKKSN